MSALTLFRDGPAADTAHTPGGIVSGAPETRYAIHATSEHGRLSAGVWHATPGAWRVDYTEWEYCHVTAGRARLTEDGRPPIEVAPGDSFTLAPGFAGVWEVLEPMTKHFVILDPPA